MTAHAPNPPHLAESRPPDPVLQLYEFLRAVQVMKLYAAAEGIAIPEPISAHLAALSKVESAFAEQRGSRPQDVPVTLPQGVDLTQELERAIVVHGEMSKLVAPATPDSIIYTQPPVGFRDFYRRQRVLFWLLLAAFGAVAGFVSCVMWKGLLTELSTQQQGVIERLGDFEKRLHDLEAPATAEASEAPDLSVVIADLERRNDELGSAIALLAASGAQWPQTDVALALNEANDRPTSVSMATGKIRAAAASVRDRLRLTVPKPGWRGILCDQLTDFFAAMLGAAFYTLYTANRYMVARTFDRAYTTHYVVRFVLGVVAGMILANFGEYLLTEKAAGAPKEAVVTLTQTLFALIGGYSADAVNAIFTRVAETLTTLVRGSPPPPPPAAT